MCAKVAKMITRTVHFDVNFVDLSRDDGVERLVVAVFSAEVGVGNGLVFGIE